MFSKKCPRCKNKVKKDYDFCPFCSFDLREKYDKDDYGMLGKNDFINNFDLSKASGGSFIEKMLNNAMKELPAMMRMIEKQMNEQNIHRENLNPQKIPNNLNIHFFVNGKRILPVNQEIKPVHIPVKIKNKLSDDKKEKIAKLPREEPSSKVRRMSGKVIYEFAMPGVENIEDVLINRLENSIEIKAISEDKVYSKILNVKLPIIGYKLNEGNLILELQTQ